MRAAEALIADAPGGTWSLRDLTVRIYDLHTDPTEPQLRTVRPAVAWLARRGQVTMTGRTVDRRIHPMADSKISRDARGPGAAKAQVPRTPNGQSM